MGTVEGVEPNLPAGDRHEHESVIHAVPFDERFQPARRYALILMLDVLEHLDDPVAALRHAVGLLEPDGIVLITVPAFRILWTRHDEINRHRTRYRIATIRQLAAQAGLRLHDQRYFFHWIFPVKLLVRLKEAIIAASPKVPRVPQPVINRALITYSLIERRLLRWLRLPFGSSLLIVGGRPAPDSSADAR
jgi:SAM-dependent methyltransferase